MATLNQAVRSINLTPHASLQVRNVNPRHIEAKAHRWIKPTHAMPQPQTSTIEKKQKEQYKLVYKFVFRSCLFKVIFF